MEVIDDTANPSAYVLLVVYTYSNSPDCAPRYNVRSEDSRGSISLPLHVEKISRRAALALASRQIFSDNDDIGQKNGHLM